MKKIGIVGSRRRNAGKDYTKIYLAFLKVFEKNNTIIISGGCLKGGDRFAEGLARKFGIPITIYHANWKLGKHAGFLRNTDIAKNSSILIACIAPDRKGGTEDTIKKFKKFHPTNKIILC